MSFRRELVNDIYFPEDPRLKRAIGNEVCFALPLILKGYDLVYVPTNPVFHIIHPSLSRWADKENKESSMLEYSIIKMNIMRILKGLRNAK